MMIREDNVVSVTYPDGGLFVQHADGTQMYTRGNDIRIEKQGLASHRVRMLTEEE
jgi:flagellar basal body rod protein FlgF